jgi:CRISPR-associated protein Csd1
MTILQALNSYYDRMAAWGEAEPVGYSREKISYAILLKLDGAVAAVNDIRDTTGKKPAPIMMNVPAGVKRTVGIASNKLWDKTAYVLGVTAGEGKRTAQEHEAFKATHAALLADTDDAGLLAVRRFLENWTPAQFEENPHFTEEMKDANFVFRPDGVQEYIHDRPAARALVTAAPGGEGDDLCLVTGTRGTAARLHPSIKGVWGAQSSGASLVSFNLDAFTSYGKEQGANAPVSEEATARYGAALNRMLDKGSRNRIQVGDTTTVFWADASGASADAADEAAALFFDPPTDREEAGKIKDQLEAVAKGLPAAELSTKNIDPGTRFYILGLAPNAARLSVRFWFDGTFGDLERRIREHWQDMAIAPPPKAWPPSARSIVWLTARTKPNEAPSEKDKKSVNRISADLMQAILTGGAYPQTLLQTIMARVRAGDRITGLHAAVCKAFIVRNSPLEEKDMKPGLNPDSLEPAYHLGRLFAVIEQVQRTAHRTKLNSTVRDKFYTTASTAPASVFGTLFSNMKDNVGKIRKENPGLAFYFDKTVGDILNKMSDDWPKTLPLKEQARFTVGYYHQRFGKMEASAEIVAELEEKESDDE